MRNEMQWHKALVLFISLVHSRHFPDAEDRKPEACIMPQELMHEQCCVLPPFFTREVARKCGARSQILFIDTNHNVSAFRRLSNDNDNRCDHWNCVLREYRFLSPDGTYVDDEKYFVHLDKWADLNPSFITVITNARVHCKNFFRMFMPLEICQLWKLNTCIRNFVKTDCPMIIPSKACQALKLFFDECREYYI